MYEGQLYPVTGDEINDRLGKILEKLGGTSGGGGGGGSLTVSPVEYNVSATSEPSIGAVATTISPVQTIPRKIDIVNTGANPVWIARGAAAAAGRSYDLLALGAALTVDEPTRDYFSAIAPGGDTTISIVERVANGDPNEPIG